MRRRLLVISLCAAGLSRAPLGHAETMPRAAVSLHLRLSVEPSRLLRLGGWRRWLLTCERFGSNWTSAGSPWGLALFDSVICEPAPPSTVVSPEIWTLLVSMGELTTKLSLSYKGEILATTDMPTGRRVLALLRNKQVAHYLTALLYQQLPISGRLAAPFFDAKTNILTTNPGPGIDYGSPPRNLPVVKLTAAGGNLSFVAIGEAHLLERNGANKLRWQLSPRLANQPQLLFIRAPAVAFGTNADLNAALTDAIRDFKVKHPLAPKAVANEDEDSATDENSDLELSLPDGDASARDVQGSPPGPGGEPVKAQLPDVLGSGFFGVYYGHSAVPGQLTERLSLLAAVAEMRGSTLHGLRLGYEYWPVATQGTANGAISFSSSRSKIGWSLGTDVANRFVDRIDCVPSVGTWTLQTTFVTTDNSGLRTYVPFTARDSLSLGIELGVERYLAKATLRFWTAETFAKSQQQDGQPVALTSARVGLNAVKAGTPLNWLRKTWRFSPLAFALYESVNVRSNGTGAQNAEFVLGPVAYDVIYLGGGVVLLL